MQFSNERPKRFGERAGFGVGQRVDAVKERLRRWGRCLAEHTTSRRRERQNRAPAVGGRLRARDEPRHGESLGNNRCRALTRARPCGEIVDRESVDFAKLSQQKKLRVGDAGFSFDGPRRAMQLRDEHANLTENRLARIRRGARICGHFVGGYGVYELGSCSRGGKRTAQSNYQKLDRLGP